MTGSDMALFETRPAYVEKYARPARLAVVLASAIGLWTALTLLVWSFV